VAIIKVPNIVSGDTLSSSTYNELQENIQDLKVEQENIAQEGINKSKVPTNVLLKNRFFSPETTSSNSITYPLAGGEMREGEFLFPGSGGFASKSLITHNTPFSNDGSQIICRASAEVFIQDYGSRTFFQGVPPTCIVQLFYCLEESPDVSSDWKPCLGTKQMFSLAFSSKIPSDSGGNFHMKNKMVDLGHSHPVNRRDFDDRPDLFTYDNEDALGNPGADSYNVETNSKMFFDGRFSYTTSFLLNYEDLALSDFTASIPSSGVNKVSFCLAGGVYLPSSIGFPAHPPGTATVGTNLDNYGKGCGQVRFRNFELQNFSLSTVALRA